MDKEIVKIEQRYAEKVRAAMPVKMVVLYGSHVSGKPHKDSDIGNRTQFKDHKASMTKEHTQHTGEILIYAPKGQKTQIDVSLQDDSVWLTLNQISDLFERDKSVISRHLQNVFKSNELAKKSTVAKFATVQIEGDRRTG